MLKVVDFKDVNFNEFFSYGGYIYRKIICDTGDPGAVRISDGKVFDSCEDWFCSVGRREEQTIEPPKERKKYLFRDMATEHIYGLSLTDEQMAFFKWLDEHEFLIDLRWEYADNLDFMEIY